MQLSQIIAFVVGLALVVGAQNKSFLGMARKVGHAFAFLQRGSFVLARLDEKDKDRIARLWLYSIGGLLMIAAILSQYAR